MTLRTGLSSAGLLAVLAAAGCRSFGPPLDEPEFRRRAAAAAAERGRLASLSAEYSLSVEGAKPGGGTGRLRCSGVIVAQGGRLRMRGEKALGLAKVFDLLLDGRDVKVSLIPRSKFFRGGLDRLAAARGFGALLEERGALDLARLVLPTPELDGPEPAELLLGEREVEAIWRAPGGGRIVRRTTFAADTAEVLSTEFMDQSGRVVLTIDYRELLECGALHPVRGFRLRVEGPARLRLEISFSDLEVNGPVRPAAFVLEPPAGFAILDLEDRPAEPAPGAPAKNP